MSRLPFKSLESFQNSAADLANMDPSYWAGTHLDGDISLNHEDSDDDEQIDELRVSIAVPDTSDTEEEEQVGGGHKWLEATGPTTPLKMRLRADIKPTPHVSASTKASMVRRAEAAKSPPLPPPREITTGSSARILLERVAASGEIFECDAAASGSRLKCASAAAFRARLEPPPLPQVLGAPAPLPAVQFRAPVPLPATQRKFWVRQCLRYKRNQHLRRRIRVHVFFQAQSAFPAHRCILHNSPLAASLSAAFTVATTSGSTDDPVWALPERHPHSSPGTINIKDFTGDLSTFLDMGGFSPIRLPPPPSALDLLPQNIQEVNIGGVGGAGGDNFEGDNLGGNNFQDYDLEGDNFRGAGDGFEGDNLGGASGEDLEGGSFGGADGDLDRSFQDIDHDADSGSDSEDDEPEIDGETEAMLAATCEQMLAVAAMCSADAGISQEWVLKRFHASHNELNTRRPHRWNIYQAYANHEMNRVTEIHRTWLGADTPLDAKIPPLTKSEVTEAYLVFIEACGGLEKAEEILFKHAEWASTEEVTTYEGRQRKFLAVRRCLDSMIGKIEAQDDFQAIYFIGGLYCHQDSQLAGSSHILGLYEFFNKLNYSEDQVLAALKSAMYDCELKKLHALKARDGTSDASATTSPAPDTSSAGASGSKPVPVKFERSTSKQPNVKHDYSGMTQDEIDAMKRKLATACHIKAKDATNAVQDCMRAMSISDTPDGIDLFKGNGFK
ncbi:hypothetical protein B0H14DRAFT_3438636 [Mycena olivaceomarginata]|nr:hypothetical protein B0H14DRAFT_3438636 [Mycena olivaceomarginata]